MTMDTTDHTSPARSVYHVAGSNSPAPEAATCPTCGAVLPDLIREQDQIDAALDAHSEILEGLGDALTHEQFAHLEAAASDIFIATENAIRTRLLRLRPELADLIDLAAGVADYDAYPTWRTRLMAERRHA